MRNDVKLRELNLKVRYYYLSVLNGGRITVALVQDRNGMLTRGTSYCDPRDQFVRATGRAIAVGRAIQAYEHRDNVVPCPRKFSDAYESAPDFLGEYNTMPTEFEKTHLFNIKT